MLGRFFDDKSGAIAIIFAVTLPIVVLLAGGAVDCARWYSAKSHTKNALDSAVLAGARTLMLTGDVAAAKSAAQGYYARNVVKRLNVLNDTVTFAISDSNTIVTGSGTADIATTFLKLAGIATLPLIANPSASFPKARITGGGGGNIEVAVMMDITGSMCPDGKGPCKTGTKIDALKAATKDLVNIVVRDDQSIFTSRVALVPFAKRIRMAPDGSGGSIMKILTGLDPTWSGWYEECTQTGATTVGSGESGTSTECLTEASAYKSNWKIKPCVTDRFYESPYGIDGTDDAPGPGRWLNAYGGRREPISRDSANTPLIGPHRVVRCEC